MPGIATRRGSPGLARAAGIVAKIAPTGVPPCSRGRHPTPLRGQEPSPQPENPQLRVETVTVRRPEAFPAASTASTPS
jgi:hypothetical protein